VNSLGRLMVDPRAEFSHGVGRTAKEFFDDRNRFFTHIFFKD
jgi:hypothetical protein